MNNEILNIAIQSNAQFYTLYADGAEDTMIQTPSATVLQYAPQTIVFLYYTFPTHRRVYCIRNTMSQKICALPGLSHQVTVLFKQFASRVDKTKKAVSFLREHYIDNVFLFDDVFYYRLDILLKSKGKLDYYELDALCKRSL